MKVERRRNMREKKRKISENDAKRRKTNVRYIFLRMVHASSRVITNI